MAIDEKRCYYRQNLFGTRFPQNLKQVWFAGAHSDIGGSYPLNESGLSQLTLEWMMLESMDFGLLLNKDRVKEIMNDALEEVHSLPNYHEKIHKSLNGFWWFLEFLPKGKRDKLSYYIPSGRSRKLYEDSLGNPIVPTIHQSAIAKMGVSYAPLNFNPKVKNIVY